MCSFLKFYVLRINDCYLLNPWSNEHIFIVVYQQFKIYYINGHFTKELFCFVPVPLPTFSLLNFSHSRHINRHGQSNDREGGLGPWAAICSRQTGLCSHIRAGKYSSLVSVRWGCLTLAVLSKWELVERTLVPRGGSSQVPGNLLLSGPHPDRTGCPVFPLKKTLFLQVYGFFF